MEIVPLLQRLIAVDSTSARSNLPVLDLLEEVVRPLGFETRRQRWRDEQGVEKGNLVCRRGPELPGGLALLGHTDCVPFDPGWTEALAGAVREGKVFGRGACDTKGFIACAVAAAASASRQPPRPLHLLFTADEEAGCWGAKKLLEEGRVKPRFAIDGEPTSLVPIRAHKGYAAVDVEVSGLEGHSSYPELGASAVHAGARLVADLLGRVQAELARLQDPLFAPPHTTYNVGVIEGGKARNIIAGRCGFTLEWRPLPDQDPRLGLRLFEEAAARVEAESGGRIKVAHTPMRLDGAAVTPEGAEIVRFLEEETGNAARSVPYGTELPELLAMGAEGCVFGPGDIRVAHRTGEHVEQRELERCAAVLGRALARFSG
jgi:acetylornithine deacetylase